MRYTYQAATLVLKHVPGGQSAVVVVERAEARCTAIVPTAVAALPLSLTYAKKDRNAGKTQLMAAPRTSHSHHHGTTPVTSYMYIIYIILYRRILLRPSFYSTEYTTP